MLQVFRLQMQTARMMVEAQTVIGMRMMGMAGLMPAAQGETLLMVTEKQTAFADAWMAGAQAMLSGASPGQVYGKALAPIGRATSANSRRLTRRTRR
ncbi:antifreeze protein [Jannaschia formosa]|uniref:antifreeze protein n=1 Tax=Jannaschia formosa TaxID=2259592 RepID=UPI001431C44E|nr:antifreeze protein [Jannaschia formosa]